MQKRKLGRGLQELLSGIEGEATLPRLAEIHRGKKPIISVLRTKGGSGESHVVAALLRKLDRLGRTALIVSQHPDSKIRRYAQATWQPGVEHHDGHGHMFKRWRTFLDEDSAAFAASTFDTAIFCEGTSSGVSGRSVREVAEISEFVVLSVNLSVHDSFDAAARLVDSAGEDTPGPASKVFFLCWLCRSEPTAPHEYVVLGAEDYVHAYSSGSVDLIDPGASVEELLDRKLFQLFVA